MATLPGQRNTSGGVSNLLFGTNVPPYAMSAFLANTQTQQTLKSCGVTLLRCAVTDQNSNPLADNTILQIANACATIGAAMLAIIPHGSQTYANHLVTLLGNRCNLYELSNEPDLNHISQPQYSAMWNTWIPGLRKLNPNAAFIGPTLGVVSNFNSYLKPWLASAVAAGATPDGVSYHDYPCTSQPPQATCASKMGNIGSDGASLRALVTSVAGRAIPICCTEYNVDASNNRVSYALNAAFVNSWTIGALEGMAQNRIEMACHFFYQDIANGSSQGISYAPLATEIKKYAAGGSPPASIPIVTPITSSLSSMGQALGGNLVQSVFGGQGFVPAVASGITIAPNADVTQLLADMDKAMVIQNPFTENMSSLPTDTLGIAGAGFTFTDPFSYIEQLGTNLFVDAAAGFYRFMFILIGIIILIKVISEFIDYDALGEAVGALAARAVAAGALA